MPDISVSERGILQLLNNLKTSEAVGPDGIHARARTLKETALEIAPILKCLFQKSLDSGSLLEDWRSANICSIYKKRVTNLFPLTIDRYHLHVFSVNS